MCAIYQSNLIGQTFEHKESRTVKINDNNMEY